MSDFPSCERTVPVLCERGLTAEASYVSEMNDFIGTRAAYCTLHYSHPSISYNYAYDYNVVRDGSGIAAYYVGTDRFYRAGSTYRKCYTLLELAVIVSEEGEQDAICAHLLLRHLREMARVTGCTAIACGRAGANAAFTEALLKLGYTDNGKQLVLSVPDAVMPEWDRAIIPTERDALSFSSLFFLREYGCRMGDAFCTYENNGGRITVERSSGACAFSAGVHLHGSDVPNIQTRFGISLVELCMELFGRGVTEGIEVFPLHGKPSADAPDVIVGGDYAIFICETREETDLSHMRAMRARLKGEGCFTKFSLYHFRFDEELGGMTSLLYHMNVN